MEMIEPGTRFFRLVVIELAEKRKTISGSVNFRYKCKCDCGAIKIIFDSMLKSGRTKSCGCLQKELLKKRLTTHGMTNTKTFKTWESMKERCTRQNTKYYKHYGGRGIKVCERWQNSFENFLKDMGEKPDGLTLDRIDPDKDYSPENCRWSSTKEQNNNKRNNVILEFNNEKKTVAEWADFLGMKIGTLRSRLERGWTIEKAFFTEIDTRCHRVRN
jgi:hypothetical protein